MYIIINFLLIYFINNISTNKTIQFILAYLLVYMNIYSFFLMKDIFFNLNILDSYYIFFFYNECDPLIFSNEVFVIKNPFGIGIYIMHMKNDNGSIGNNIIFPDSHSCYTFDKNHINNLNKQNPIISINNSIPLVGAKVETVGDALNKITEVGKKNELISINNHISNISSKMDNNSTLYIPNQGEESLFPADLFTIKVVGDKIHV